MVEKNLRKMRKKWSDQENVLAKQNSFPEPQMQYLEPQESFN